MKRKRKLNTLDACFGETLPERTIQKPIKTGWLEASQAQIQKAKATDNRWTIECDPGLELLGEALSMGGRLKVVTRKR